MAFTEFYTHGGNDKYAGSTDTTTPFASDTAGAWDGTSIYTASSGTPFASVTAGMWASVLSHGGTSTGFIARVVSVGGGGASLTLSTTAIGGTNPGALTTGNADCYVGGAWSTLTPSLTLVTSATTDASGDMPRCNWQNGASYTPAATPTRSANGPVIFQGYTTTPGDLGKATIDVGGSSTLSALSITGTHNVFRDIIAQNGGTAAGGSSGILANGGRTVLDRVIVHDFGGRGISIGSPSELIECETYNCNKGNNASIGGIYIGASATLRRCISHDNTTGTTAGFYFNVASSSGVSLHNCVADRNSGAGYVYVGDAIVAMVQCDAFNNTSHGFSSTATDGIVRIENSNFVLNGGFGISVTATGGIVRAVTCGFFNNTSGQVATSTALINENPITYASTPYNNASAGARPSGGDFTISLAAAQGTGRGVFQQASSIYSATSTAFPDVGAVQHQASGGGGGGVGNLVNGGLVQ